MPTSWDGKNACKEVSLINYFNQTTCAVYYFLVSHACMLWQFSGISMLQILPFSEGNLLYLPVNIEDWPLLYMKPSTMTFSKWSSTTPTYILVKAQILSQSLHLLECRRFYSFLTWGRNANERSRNWGLCSPWELLCPTLSIKKSSQGLGERTTRWWIPDIW